MRFFVFGAFVGNLSASVSQLSANCRHAAPTENAVAMRVLGIVGNVVIYFQVLSEIYIKYALRDSTDARLRRNLKFCAGGRSDFF